MPDKLSAFHEAGHATIAYLLGEFPERVSIRRKGDSYGHMRYLGVEADQVARAAILGTREIDRDIVMANLLAAAAGPVAQSLKMNGVRSSPFPWTTFGGFRDHAIATKLMGAAGDLLYTTLEDVADEASDLLKARWDAVERVAAELMRYKEIGFEELRAAILGFVDAKETA